MRKPFPARFGIGNICFIKRPGGGFPIGSPYFFCSIPSMLFLSSLRLIWTWLVAGLVFGALGAPLSAWAATGGGGHTFAPTAVADARSTGAGMPISFSVLTNDQAAGILDPETINLMPTSGRRRHTRVEVANEGTFALDPNGQLTFTPAAGFAGAVKITYTVRDYGGHCSAPAVVTIYVAACRPVHPNFGQPTTPLVLAPSEVSAN